VSALEVDPVFSAAALAAGRAERARRAALLGRVEPPRRDPVLMAVAPTVELVAMVEAVVDADPRLLELVDEQIEVHRRWVAAAAGRPVCDGRPPEFERRTMVVAFLLLAFTQNSFHLVNLPGLLGELPVEVRDRLGIDRVVKVPNTGLAGTEADYRPTQITYRQILGFLHLLADAFDPTLRGLDGDAEVQRASALQELLRLLVDAPRRALAPGWVPPGDVAVDATMKWAWNRPPGRSGKVPRRGKDGDAGETKSLGEIVGDVDLADLGFDDFDAPRNAPEPAEPAEPAADAAAADEAEDAPEVPAEEAEGPEDAAEEVAPAGPGRERRAPNRRRSHGGAAWVGRKQMGDGIFGYALHTAVNTGDGPAVVMHAALTRAPANPPAATLPLLRDLHDTRAQDPAVAAAGVRPLGDVVADGVYSAPWGWQLGIRALGGSPVFRLHPTNQEGRQLIGGSTFLNGRPICECCPRELDEPWPRFRDRPKRADYAAANRLAAERIRWEWAGNGKAKPDGRRQFLSPHGTNQLGGQPGGCEHCVTADGEAVLGADGLPKPRCCTTRSKVFTAEDLRWYQDHSFGTLEWYRQWNVRNRVEGSYGIVKNLSLMNYGRDYHHLTGLSRESIAAGFALAAHNMHMIRSWQARHAELERRRELIGTVDEPEHLPPAAPTETLPPRPKPAAPKPVHPKGLPELGADPP
jgi:hypothetical protein